MLDMGRPIKILDLAKEIARLMGVAEDKMQIRFIGLRPGEKLEEDLEADQEIALPTAHKKIKSWKTNVVPQMDVDVEITELIEAVKNNAQRDHIIQVLKRIVPEYDPSTY